MSKPSRIRKFWGQRFSGRTLAILTSISLTAMLSHPVRAAVVVTVKQVGSAVVIQGSGSLNLAGLQPDVASTIYGHVYPSRGGLLIAGKYGESKLDVYHGVFGAADFGPGSFLVADAHTGDAFGAINAFYPELGNLYVPKGYVSGGELSGSETFLDATVAGLGFTVGTYKLFWGAGRAPETFTINVLNGVPEPANWALLIAGFGVAGIAARRHPRKRNEGMAF